MADDDVDEPTAPSRAGAVARLRPVVVALVAVAVVALVAVAVTRVLPLSDGRAAGTRSPDRQSAPQKPKPEPPQKVLDALVAATTGATLPRAPGDPSPRAGTDGVVVRPEQVLAVRDAPDGRPFAKVGPTQVGELWLPEIARKDAWTQVMLPSRPNGSTGWVRTSLVERRSSPYLVRVHVGSRTLELFDEGRLDGTWPVAVGAPATPTPTGRTFVLGSITDPNQSYSPVILPLGWHSDTLDSYGGGPGTVALHTWPDASVFGTAASHGCIRVPADALDRLTQVPLGSLVVIDDK